MKTCELSISNVEVLPRISSMFNFLHPCVSVCGGVVGVYVFRCLPILP